MTNQIERRNFSIDSLKIETRADGKRVMRGHAAVFNSLSENLGGFREKIKPGSFLEAVQTDDVRALFNHDPNLILGRNTAGTLRLSEDSQGLAIEIDPPDIQMARDLMVSMERGDISQMSFSFSVRDGGQSWETDENGMSIRTLTKLRLYDVSPVTYPAYINTDIALRSMPKVDKVVIQDESWKLDLKRRHLELCA